MSGTARQSNNQTNMKTNETKMTTKPNETVRDFAAEAATAGFVRRFIGALTAEEINALPRAERRKLFEEGGLGDLPIR